jgi:hypothetical protein
VTLHGRTNRRGLVGAVALIVIFFGRSVIMVRRYVGHRRGQYLRRGVDAGQRAAAAIAANPHRSNYTIAEEAGVDERTVRRARKEPTAACAAVDDERPPIDKRPKGELWDDIG